MFSIVTLLFIAFGLMFLLKLGFADVVVMEHQKAIQRMQGLKNKTSEPLYSRILYENGNATTDVDFYTGQTDFTLGNIEKDRELPVGHLMIVEEIRFAIDADAASADVQAWLSQRGCLEFAPNTTAVKRHFPLEILMAGGGIANPQLAVAADQSNLGVPHQLAAFRLRVPEVLVGGIQFWFRVLHNAAYNPSADLKVMAIMVGQRAYDASLASS